MRRETGSKSKLIALLNVSTLSVVFSLSIVGRDVIVLQITLNEINVTCRRWHQMFASRSVIFPITVKYSNIILNIIVKKSHAIEAGTNNMCNERPLLTNTNVPSSRTMVLGNQRN